MKIAAKRRIKYFPYGSKKQLVIPTGDAMEAVYGLVEKICNKTGIPKTFPGARQGGMVFGTIGSHGKGIVAHGQLSNNRTDGLVTVYYLWLRMEKKMSHKTAYDLVLGNMKEVARRFKDTGKRRTDKVISGNSIYTPPKENADKKPIVAWGENQSSGS